MDPNASVTDHAAVDILIDLATGGVLNDDTAELLAAYPHIDVPAGELLQLAVLERLRANGAEVGGWKIGWTSRGARTGAGAAGDRPFGFVMKDRVLPTGVQLDSTKIPVCKVEAEIAVRIGRELKGDNVTPEEARDAIDAVAPAFEVCSSRLRPGMSLAVRLGNALNCYGIVLGEDVPLDDIDLTALGVEFFANGEPAGVASSGPEILDDPFLSVSRVVKLLAGHGLSLSPGEWLITGSLLPPAPATPGDRFEARFETLGTVAVEF